MMAIVRELWADLRSRNSNVWQIMAFTLVAMAIFVNAISDGHRANPIFFLTPPGLAVLSFVSLFLYLVQAAMQRIWYESSERIRALAPLEAKLFTKEFAFGASTGEKSVAGVAVRQTIKIAGTLSWFPVDIVRWFVLMGWAVVTLSWTIFILASQWIPASGTDLVLVIPMAVLVATMLLHLLCQDRGTGASSDRASPKSPP